MEVRGKAVAAAAVAHALGMHTDDIVDRLAAAPQVPGRLEVVQTIPTGEQYGIAFPTGSDLLEPTNKALEEIKKDGTYAEIYQKWLGEKPEEIP